MHARPAGLPATLIVDHSLLERSKTKALVEKGDEDSVEY